jgi:lambda repressor-like predicted transcriptional regulator
MNRLPNEKRAQIIGMSVEGMSMRAVSRLVGCSINTVTKLLEEVGFACNMYNRALSRAFDPAWCVRWQLQILVKVFGVTAFLQRCCWDSEGKALAQAPVNWVERYDKWVWTKDRK